MSVFQTHEMPCPACGSAVRFEFADSVNGARRPDLREAMLDDSFQRLRCAACEAGFRLEPALTYLDVERGLWMLVRPAGLLTEWQAFESQAAEIHAEAFGAEAGRSARAIGARLQVRVTFGWPAAREKLLCAHHGLADTELELLKLGLMRLLGDPPLADDVELRLSGVQGVQGEQLQLTWVQVSTGRVVESMDVARTLYDDIAADTTSWAALRARFKGATFVDVHRLLVEPAAA